MSCTASPLKLLSISISSSPSMKSPYSFSAWITLFNSSSQKIVSLLFPIFLCSRCYLDFFLSGAMWASLLSYSFSKKSILLYTKLSSSSIVRTTTERGFISFQMLCLMRTWGVIRQRVLDCSYLSLMRLVTISALKRWISCSLVSFYIREVTRAISQDSFQVIV